MKTNACNPKSACAKSAGKPASLTLSPERYRARAEIVKALAHPTRLMIVDKLAGGECCVCDLQALAGVDISTVSKHLSLLKKAGIVEDEKRGLWVFYRLCCPCLGDFFGCIEGVLKKRAEKMAKGV